MTNAVLQLDFGLDIRATNHMDVRAFDWGAAAGSSRGSAHAGMGYFSAGMVYHFHPQNR